MSRHQAAVRREGRGKTFVFLNTRSAGGRSWRGIDEGVSGRRNGSIQSAVSAVLIGHGELVARGRCMR